jgi:DNA-binding transcriptional regulator YiaG
METNTIRKRFSGLRAFLAPRMLAMRKTMGLSQRVFPRLVGVSVKTLQNWGAGAAVACCLLS